MKKLVWKYLNVKKNIYTITNARMHRDTSKYVSIYIYIYKKKYDIFLQARVSVCQSIQKGEGKYPSFTWTEKEDKWCACDDDLCWLQYKTLPSPTLCFILCY